MPSRSRGDDHAAGCPDRRGEDRSSRGGERYSRGLPRARRARSRCGRSPRRSCAPRRARTRRCGQLRERPPSCAQRRVRRRTRRRTDSSRDCRAAGRRSARRARCAVPAAPAADAADTGRARGAHRDPVEVEVPELREQPRRVILLTDGAAARDEHDVGARVAHRLANALGYDPAESRRAGDRSRRARPARAARRSCCRRCARRREDASDPAGSSSSPVITRRTRGRAHIEARRDRSTQAARVLRAQAAARA